MIFMRSIIVTLILVFFSFNSAVYCQQKIKDFYLSNFKEDGTHDWEVRGDEAVIHEEHVDIDDMKANYYSEDDTIVITSDKAKLNKENMDVALQDNVKIQNKEGVTLSTDSLNWNRDQNHIETTDWVQTNKDAMQVKAKGLSADTEFRKVDFEQMVEATLPDQETGDLIVITCSGPLEIEYNLGQAVFNDDVVITHPQGKMFSDKAFVFFDIEAKKIKKIVCEGNVKIERANNITLAKKATFYADEARIVLEGRPHLTYYPEAKK
jgi:LPS export ABC transporter protein LptC